MPDVTFTVDGKKLTAPAGTLLIDACRKAGIEIPAFCYYPGLSLQAACRMCVVRQEKVPKLQTACTTTVAEGQVFTTESEEIAQARKGTLQLLLGNHPLDCPVCDAGGECELQDMVFKYGAGESLYADAKNHREEQQWSPAVYYDRPRCILCYRCVRECGEGMDVFALAVQNRGSSAVIAPNVNGKDGESDQLDCEQCGNCIDICPVGALTSGSYRYRTRPWEMNHVSTVCTHCGDGCKVTLGIRTTASGSEIVRADNRDKSGINDDFLCAKGRFGFDFVENSARLFRPLVRNAHGALEPATWEQALHAAASRLKAVRDEKGGAAIGVIGSNRATNEENYLLQKLARTVLSTSNIDHERTTDYAAFAQALAGKTGRTASLKDIGTAPAILLIGGNPTEEHPLLANLIRTAVRLNKTRLYIANAKPIKLDRQARFTQLVTDGDYSKLAAFLEAGTADFAKTIAAEESLIVIFGSEFRGDAVGKLVAWGLKRANVRFAYLGDHSNSRGAADMGLLPDLLPGYVPAPAPGKTLGQMLAAASTGDLDALLVVGADPVTSRGLNAGALKNTFVVAVDLFLTPTAAAADVVFPAASLYEKSGTLTNTFGDVQLLRKGADRPGAKPEFEILVRLALALGADIKTLVPVGTAGTTGDLGQSRGAQTGEADRTSVYLKGHGLEPRLSPFDPIALLDEISSVVPGYQLDRINLLGGNAVRSEIGAASAFVPVAALHSEIVPAHDGLFTSSTLGRYSKGLNEIAQHQTCEPTATAAD
jgi:NADH-quinone oxidoreductase subunit G